MKSSVVSEKISKLIPSVRYSLGRCGTAITLVTQYDVKLMHKIEDRINKQLTEYRVKEKEVLKLLVEISMTRSQVEIQLDEEDFGETENINKRKHRILEQEVLAEENSIEKKEKRKRKHKKSKSKDEK